MSMFSVSCQHSLGTILSRHVPPSLHACKEWLDQNYVVFFFFLGCCFILFSIICFFLCVVCVCVEGDSQVQEIVVEFD